MTPHVLTTRSVPKRDQFEVWRTWFDPLFDIAPRMPAHRGFEADHHVWTLGSVAVSRLSAPAVHAARATAHLRRDPIDHWVLSYSLSGTLDIRISGAQVQVPPGQPIVWSLGDEMESERTSVTLLQMFLSRDAFGPIGPLLDAARGRVLNTPQGRLLGDFLVALGRRAPALAAKDLPGLASAVQSMVAACVAPSRGRLSDAMGQIDVGRLEQVRQAVKLHLRAPALGVDMLCQTTGISRAALDRLFDGAAGLARFIQLQRLIEAHAELCDPARSQPIEAIAMELCFVDAASFGRAFRKQFGQDPGDVRAAAMSGFALPHSIDSQPAAAHFSDLLHRL